MEIKKLSLETGTIPNDSIFSSVLLFPAAASGAAAAVAAAAAFSFIPAQLGHGKYDHSRQDCQYNDVSHFVSSHANADIGIRVPVFPNRQIDESRQRRQRHNCQKAEAGFPGHQPDQLVDNEGNHIGKAAHIAHGD